MCIYVEINYINGYLDNIYPVTKRGLLSTFTRKQSSVHVLARIGHA